MPALQYTKEDLLRGKKVDPGWYNVKVTGVKPYEAKSDGSQNWDVEMKIIGGPFEGVPVKKTFNEKAPGFAIRFAAAFGYKPSPDGGEIDLEKTVGRSLKIYIKNDMYNGRPTNKIEDYAPTQG